MVELSLKEILARRAAGLEVAIDDALSEHVMKVSSLPSSWARRRFFALLLRRFEPLFFTIYSRDRDDSSSIAEVVERKLKLLYVCLESEVPLDREHWVSLEAIAQVIGLFSEPGSLPNIAMRYLDLVVASFEDLDRDLDQLRVARVMGFVHHFCGVILDYISGVPDKGDLKTELRTWLPLVLVAQDIQKFREQIALRPSQEILGWANALR